MEQYISTLISTLLSIYLPFNDMGTRMAVSLALSQIITQCLSFLFEKIKNVEHISTIFWREKYIIIDSKNPIYEKIIEHLCEKFKKYTTGCKIITRFGKKALIIDKLSCGYIVDQYKGHKFRISFISKNSEKNSSDKDRSSTENVFDRDVVISSNCPISIINDYVDVMIKMCNNKISKEILIHKLEVDDGKNRFVRWSNLHKRICKNFSNTIVSDEVDKLFYQDVQQFMASEQDYVRKGIPYKRGYILYGKPGVGKTSLIKVIANEYQLPIFILDLSILRTNAELTKVINEISYHISPNDKYLLVMEDVDRCRFFKKNRRYYGYDDDGSKDTISEDCILNILDGIDESYGRITIMTTNDISILESVKALCRPGRIDMKIQVNFCDAKQIERILELFFGEKVEGIDEQVSISPTNLIKMIQYLKQLPEIIGELNRIKKFDDHDVIELLKNERVPDGHAIRSSKESDDDYGDDDSDEVPKNNSTKKNYSREERAIARKIRILNKYNIMLEKTEKELETKSERDRLVFEKQKLQRKILELDIRRDKERVKSRIKNNRLLNKYARGEIEVDFDGDTDFLPIKLDDDSDASSKPDDPDDDY